MRIIAGKLRGRKLATLHGSAIRPTADRVREAIFNILGQKPLDATVLDLFSGTGALGLEALSRGARKTVFVDHHAESLALLHKNLRLCGVAAETQVIRWDIRQNLNCLRPFGPAFDLVFMDPPYRNALVQPALACLTQLNLLAPAALIVAEHAPDETIDPAPADLQLDDQRRYGRTRISFFSRAVSNIASSQIPC